MGRVVPEGDRTLASRSGRFSSQDGHGKNGCVMKSAGPVLAPILPGVPAREMIDLARAIARANDDHAVVLSVVEVPEEKSLSESVTVARRRRALLRRLGAEADADPSVEFNVRAARSFDQGVREAIEETSSVSMVLGWRGTMRSEYRLRRSPLDALILDPPCNLVIFKSGKSSRLAGDESSNSSQVDNFVDLTRAQWPPRNILLPIRGGPYAELSLSLARKLATAFDADLTVMRIQRESADGQTDLWSLDGTQLDLDRIRLIEVTSDDVEEAIAVESENFDMLILGASARHPRASHLFGYLPELLADRTSAHVLIVKTADQFAPEVLSQLRVEPSARNGSHISTLVDQWFAENTFHSHEFEDIDQLVELKQNQNLTISVALPALNEESTIGKIISMIKQRFMDSYGLIDEMIVIDSNSEDATVAIAESLGVPVFSHSDILPEYGTYVRQRAKVYGRVCMSPAVISSCGSTAISPTSTPNSYTASWGRCSRSRGLSLSKAITGVH